MIHLEILDFQFLNVRHLGFSAGFVVHTPACHRKQLMGLTLTKQTVNGKTFPHVTVSVVQVFTKHEVDQPACRKKL